ncbi:MAG: response regulator transcription factor [Desulfobacteraceae bacterium]|jgi:two-component system response regulator NreC|nr:response regulator transcription factor [Desulfobacteraceae bacterium]
MKKKIIIVEDNSLLLDGLRLIIESDEQLEVTAEAKDGLAAIETAANHPADLILIDLSMPKMNGMSAIKEIRQQNADIKIMALTIHQSEEYILECFASGADGYCVKDSGQKELLNAIHFVLSGKKYISPIISEKVMEGFLEGRKHLKKNTSFETLTQREKQVLKVVGEGFTSKEIAEMLYISPKTVEKHRANLMNKLDIHNISELTAYAIKKGLVVNTPD